LGGELGGDENRTEDKEDWEDEGRRGRKMNERKIVLEDILIEYK
jgi:hypothetical protein